MQNHCNIEIIKFIEIIILEQKRLSSIILKFDKRLHTIGRDILWIWKDLSFV